MRRDFGLMLSSIHKADYVDDSIMELRPAPCANRPFGAAGADFGPPHNLGARTESISGRGCQWCGSPSFSQASHAPEAIVMPPQSASDTVKIPGYEATICVLQNHAAGLVNDTCRARSTQRER